MHAPSPALVLILAENFGCLGTLLFAERRGLVKRSTAQPQMPTAASRPACRAWPRPRLRRGRKCQRADEQAHGEADAAQQRRAVDLRASWCIGGRGATPVRSASQIAPNTPTCLPTNSPSSDRQRQRLQAARQAADRPRRRWPAEQRHDREHHPRDGCQCSSRLSGDWLRPGRAEWPARRAPRRWSRGRRWQASPATAGRSRARTARAPHPDTPTTHIAAGIATAASERAASISAV